MSLLTAGQQFDFWKARAEDTSTIFPTGLRGWDRLLRRGGMQRKELFGLAAKDGTGKTFVALNIISNLVRAGHPTVFISSEMSAEDVTNRLIGIHYGLPVSDIEDQQLFEQLPGWVEAKYKEDFGPNLVIDDTSGPSLQQIKVAIEESNIRLGRKPAVVIQDYIEFISQEGLYGNNSEKLARIAQELKNIARVQDVVFLVLLQNNKGTDDAAGVNHGHRKITKEDIYGGISKHLGIVYGLWRKGLDPNLDPDEKAMYRDTIQLSIVKNRFGPINIDGETYTVDWRTLQLHEIGAESKEAA